MDEWIINYAHFQHFVILTELGIIGLFVWPRYRSYFQKSLQIIAFLLVGQCLAMLISGSLNSGILEYYFTDLNKNDYEYYAFQNRMQSPLFWAKEFSIFLSLLVAVLLCFHRFRKQWFVVLFAAMLFAFIPYFNTLCTIYVSLNRDYLPSSWVFKKSSLDYILLIEQYSQIALLWVIFYLSKGNRKIKV